MREERVVLEHHADLAPVRRPRRHVRAVDPDRPVVRRLEPGDQVEHRRLAAARRAEEGQELAGLDLEREAVDGRDRAEPLGETDEAEAGAVPPRRDRSLATSRPPTARSGPGRPRGSGARSSPRRPAAPNLRHDAEEAERHEHLERRHGGQERIELVLGDRAPHLPRQRRGGGAADEQRDHDLVERDDRREERARRGRRAARAGASPAGAPATPSRPGSGPRARAGGRARAPPPRRSGPRTGTPRVAWASTSATSVPPRPTAANPA